MSVQSKPKLRDRARGRWRGMLPQLGVSPRFLKNKHGPCPMCGGTDRFRFDDKDGLGTFFCSVCGAGDGVRLVELVNNVEFKEAAEMIEAIMGEVKVVAPKPAASDDAKQEAMRDVWKVSRPVDHRDPVGRYLQGRLGDIHRFPRCLRTVDRLKYYDEDLGTSYHPAMLALVRDPDDNAVNIHRTYLTPDGAKAALPSSRKMMAGELPKGSAVRLFPFYEDTLGIAEGIETAWAAHLLFDVPVWSSINATMLMDWRPPKDVRRIMIFGDNDRSFTGQMAAFSLAYRLKVKEGYAVEVHIPETEQTDWNDVFREKVLA